MKNIIKFLIRLVCMVCLTFMAVHTACAQSDEFATWTGVKLNYKVTVSYTHLTLPTNSLV